MVTTVRTQPNWMCKPLIDSSKIDSAITGTVTTALAAGKYADCSKVQNLAHLPVQGDGCCMDIVVTTLGTATTKAAYLAAEPMAS